MMRSTNVIHFKYANKIHLNKSYIYILMLYYNIQDIISVRLSMFFLYMYNKSEYYNLGKFVSNILKSSLMVNTILSLFGPKE